MKTDAATSGIEPERPPFPLENADETEKSASEAPASEAADVTGQRSLAPIPLAVDQTGLSLHFLVDLLCKHLLDGGVLTIKDLACRLGLTGGIVEQLLQFGRREALVELRPHQSGLLKDVSGLRFSLTDKGTVVARSALLRAGYVGPAPVPLADYQRIVAAQSVHSTGITRSAVAEHFAGTVIPEGLLDKLGTALNSGRAIFVYGKAGTGKTYITQRLAPLFSDTCLIPHALVVGEDVVQVFDPVLHRAVEEGNGGGSLYLDSGFDNRFRLCKRPVVVSGGELTLELLNVRYDPVARLYQAPLQLKANNGLFILDDMGRQQASPMEIFNRWIVPMENREDYLALDSGRHFQVPFDVVLVFSSNINPLDLADEAFLRRIGYKLHFDPASEQEYRTIWRQECQKEKIDFDDDTFQFLVEELHRGNDVPLLPCHPRDLLGIARDRCTYLQQPLALTRDNIQWAWNNYFVRLDGATDSD